MKNGGICRYYQWDADITIKDDEVIFSYKEGGADICPLSALEKDKDNTRYNGDWEKVIIGVNHIYINGRSGQVIRLKGLQKIKSIYSDGDCTTIEYPNGLKYICTDSVEQIRSKILCEYPGKKVK